jgi:hypothetical protein
MMMMHARFSTKVRVAASGLVIVVASSMATADARANTERRKIKIKDHSPADNSCAHDVDPDRARLKKRQDDMEWTVTNTCRHDQRVLICVYRKVNGVFHRENPFDPCSSTPVSGANLEVPFAVAAHDRRILTCRAVGGSDTEVSHYVKQVLVGTEIPVVPSQQDPCPTQPLTSGSLSPHGKRSIPLHQLDIEIQP